MQRAGLDQQLPEKGVKEPKKPARTFCSQVHRASEGSADKTVAHPFWPRAGKMDACPMLQPGAQKSQPRKRER